MANPSVFFDANILLYTDDPRFPDKRQIAIDLIERHYTKKTGAVSLQVLGEYFHNARKKMHLDIPVARQRTLFFSKLLRFQPALDDVFAAIDLHQLHQFAFWDAMIVRAAIQSGCRTLFSEDWQHARRIQNVEIVNPFLR
jgi:predicted nucleic acid-binding protein